MTPQELINEFNRNAAAQLNADMQKTSKLTLELQFMFLANGWNALHDTGQLGATTSSSVYGWTRGDFEVLGFAALDNYIADQQGQGAFVSWPIEWTPEEP